MIAVSYEEQKKKLLNHPKTWLVTGAAGFIGSNLVEVLLGLGQRVVGLDNFSSGKEENLREVSAKFPKEVEKHFRLLRGDIQDRALCREACGGVDFVLHQAGLGSVPRSIENPVLSAESNVMGFFQILNAAKEAGVKKFVYASSSSVYGDEKRVPLVEGNLGNILSPYALTKLINEKTADVFERVYGVSCVGLRYFNVFGARQDPDGPYAAVIPLWIQQFLRNEKVYINGDGGISRDFCHVEDVVQANLLAALVSSNSSAPSIYNVSGGEETSLMNLFFGIRKVLCKEDLEIFSEPSHRDFRPGDIFRSVADISLAREWLGYEPKFSLESGLVASMDWYKRNLLK